jgi:hypothetical protein
VSMASDTPNLGFLDFFPRIPHAPKKRKRLQDSSDETNEKRIQKGDFDLV